MNCYTLKFFSAIYSIFYWVAPKSIEDTRDYVAIFTFSWMYKLSDFSKIWLIGDYRNTRIYGLYA